MRLAVAESAALGVQVYEITGKEHLLSARKAQPHAEVSCMEIGSNGIGDEQVVQGITRTKSICRLRNEQNIRMYDG